MTRHYDDYVNQLVVAEMDRQDAKWGDQRDHHDHFWYVILMEEIGEVANAMLEHDEANVDVEIIQCMAVMNQWAQARANRMVRSELSALDVQAETSV